MFEQALYKEVRDSFTVTNFPSLQFFFGEAPKDTPQPYIVMYVLDGNGDPQVLCDDYFDSADSFVQFNVYANDMKKSFYIKRQLDLFLTSFRSLTDGSVSYTISRTVHGASPSAQTLTNGLAVDVLAKTFNYTKES